MKVILLEDIARVGRKSEVKDVPRGHALNYLFPRKLAEPATKANLKRLQEKGEKMDAERELAAAAFETAFEKLDGKEISMQASANEQGGLFKAIREADIAEHLAQREEVVVDPSYISLPEPIKEVGEHRVSLSLAERKGEFTLKVSADREAK